MTSTLIYCRTDQALLSSVDGEKRVVASLIGYTLHRLLPILLVTLFLSHLIVDCGSIDGRDTERMLDAENERPQSSFIDSLRATYLYGKIDPPIVRHVFFLDP